MCDGLTNLKMHGKQKPFHCRIKLVTVSSLEYNSIHFSCSLTCHTWYSSEPLCVWKFWPFILQLRATDFDLSCSSRATGETACTQPRPQSRVQTKVCGIEGSHTLGLGLTPQLSPLSSQGLGIRKAALCPSPFLSFFLMDFDYGLWKLGLPTGFCFCRFK